MNKIKVGVVGLGYVGLPLAVEFGNKFETTGFDISEARVVELNNGHDSTLEIGSEYLMNTLKKGQFKITNNKSELKFCNFFIVTVPTPIDKYNRPVLVPLIKASETIGSVLKKGDIVVYESTVYPGVTEDECVPVLEKYSNLKYNNDFFVGYSPERINPGDKEHTVAHILKITSGSTEDAAEIIDNVYNQIIKAGTFKAKSIKVAEAAKVIENSQRDINIAFVNELSKIFKLLEIDTNDVLEAACTKWNFLKFQPGLVGGHCIGVDPYYLAQKAQELNYHPEIILAGRRMNDSMGKYVANEVIKLMLKKDIRIKNSNILVLGFSFKENCPDVRNTKVIDIVEELKTYEVNITIYDPHASPKEVENEYKVKSNQEISTEIKFDAIILAVAHRSFRNIELQKFKKNNSVIYDVKNFIDKNLVDGRL